MHPKFATRWCGTLDRLAADIGMSAAIDTVQSAVGPDGWPEVQAAYPTFLQNDMEEKRRTNDESKNK